MEWTLSFASRLSRGSGKLLGKIAFMAVWVSSSVLLSQPPLGPSTENDHEVTPHDRRYWNERLKTIPDNFESFQSQVDNSIQLSTVDDVERLYRANVVIGNVINDRGVGRFTLDTRTLGLYLRVLKKGVESGLSAKDAQALGALYVRVFNMENAPELTNLKKLTALGTYKRGEFIKALAEAKKDGWGKGGLSILISLADKLDPVEMHKLLQYGNDQLFIYNPEIRNIARGKSYLKIPPKENPEFIRSALRDYYEMLGTERGAEAVNNPFIREANGSMPPNASIQEIKFANLKNGNNAAAETTYQVLAQMLPEQHAQSAAISRIEKTSEDNSQKLDQIHQTTSSINRDTGHIRKKVDSMDTKLDNLGTVQLASLQTLVGVDNKLDLLIQSYINERAEREESARKETEFNTALQSGYALTTTLRALFPNDTAVKRLSEVAETGFEVKKTIFSQFESSPELACANIYMALLNLGLKLSGLTKNQKTDREVMIELFQRLEKQIQDLEYKITQMFGNTNENINLVRRNIDFQLSMLKSQLTEDNSNIQQQNADLHRQMSDLVRITLRQGENSRRQEKDRANERVGNLCQSLSYWRLRDRMQNGESLQQSDIDRETYDCSNRLAQLHYFPSRNLYTSTYSGAENIDSKNANAFYSYMGKKVQESPIEDNYGLLAMRLESMGVPLHSNQGHTSPGTETLGNTEALSPLSDEKFHLSWTRAWNQAWAANGAKGVAHTIPYSDPRLNLMRGTMKDQLRWMENYNHVAGLDSRGRVNPLLFGGLIHDNREQLDRVFSVMNERLAKALHSSGHALENYDLNLPSNDQDFDRITSAHRAAADDLYAKFVEGGTIKPCPGYYPKEPRHLKLTKEDFHKLLFAGANSDQPDGTQEKAFPTVFLTLYRLLKGEIRICYSQLDAVDERLEPLEARRVRGSPGRPEIFASPIGAQLSVFRKGPSTMDLYEHKTANPGIVIQAQYQFPFGTNATIPILSKIIPVGERIVSGTRIWNPASEAGPDVVSIADLKKMFPGNSEVIDKAVDGSIGQLGTVAGFRAQDYRGHPWETSLAQLAETWNGTGTFGASIPIAKDYKLDSKTRQLYNNVAKSTLDRFVAEKLAREVDKHIVEASGEGDVEKSIGPLRDALFGLDGARETITEALQIALGDSLYKDEKLQQLVSKLPDRGVIAKLLVANKDGIGYEQNREKLHEILEKPLTELLEHLLNPRIPRTAPQHQELERLFADSVGIYKTETEAMPEKLAEELVKMLPLPNKSKDEFDSNERRRVGDFLYWLHFAPNGPKAPLTGSRAYLQKLQDIYKANGSIKPSELTAAKEEVRLNEATKKRKAEELAFRNQVQKAKKNYDELYLSQIEAAEEKLLGISRHIHGRLREAQSYLTSGGEFPNSGHFREKQNPYFRNLEQLANRIEKTRAEMRKARQDAADYIKTLESIPHPDDLARVKTKFAKGPRRLSDAEKKSIQTFLVSLHPTAQNVKSSEVIMDRKDTVLHFHYRDSVAPTDAATSLRLLTDGTSLQNLVNFDINGALEDGEYLKRESDRLNSTIYDLQQAWKHPPYERTYDR